jgi:hypothetical protein
MSSSANTNPSTDTCEDADMHGSSDEDKDLTDKESDEGDADEEEKHYNITELNGKFLVSIIVDDEAVEYEVDASLCEVSDFLHILARHENRPDTFAISVELN